MYQLVLNALPAVDTFFFMSGLLSAYISFSQLDKKQFNLGLFYLHRYLRSIHKFQWKIVAQTISKVVFTGWLFQWHLWLHLKLDLFNSCLMDPSISLYLLTCLKYAKILDGETFCTSKTFSRLRKWSVQFHFNISCQKHDYLSNSSVWGKLGT